MKKILIIPKEETLVNDTSINNMIIIPDDNGMWAESSSYEPNETD